MKDPPADLPNDSFALWELFCVALFVIEWDGTSLKPTARVSPYLTVLYDGH